MTWRIFPKTRHILLVLLLGLSLLQSIPDSTSTNGIQGKVVKNAGGKMKTGTALTDVTWQIGGGALFNAFTKVNASSLDDTLHLDSYWMNASSRGVYAVTIIIDAAYFGTNITFIPQGDATGSVTIRAFLNGLSLPNVYYATTSTYNANTQVLTVTRPADNNPLILLWQTISPACPTCPIQPPTNTTIIGATYIAPYYWTTLQGLSILSLSGLGIFSSIVILAQKHKRRKRRYGNRTRSKQEQSKKSRTRFERND